MALSPNYGFPEPDNSSLVKNGAQDIRALGDAIDSFLFRPFSNNFIYNSNYDIWQRGTSFAASGYGADRWTNFLSNITVSRQSTGAPAGAAYYSRDTATGAGAFCSHYQYLETADVEQLQGKTVTVQIKMRRNSTNTSGQTLVIQKSATVDAGGGASWTTITSVTVANGTIPTGTTAADWYTASMTAAIPNDGTANSIRIYTEYTAGVASGSIQEFSQAMLQIGSQATPYQRMSGTIQGELAACQRYYEKSYDIGTAPATNTTVGLYSLGGSSDGSGYQRIPIKFTVPKRNASYSVATYQAGGTSGSWATIRSAGSSTGAVGFEYASTNEMEVYLQTSVTWAVCVGQGHWVVDNEL